MEVIGNVVNTLSIRVMVDKATTDDDEPTPGYLYKDLAELTFASATQSQSLQDYLIQRLQKDSFNIKLKVLRIIKHCLQSGHYSFRRELQRRTEALRDCVNYRGPPDPLKGDTPYRLVREEAQVLMNALFLGDDKNDAATIKPNAMSSGSNSSISSSAGSAPSGFHTSGIAPPPGKKYMEGFGNTPMPKQQPSGFLDNMVSKVSEYMGNNQSQSSSFSTTGHLPTTREYGFQSAFQPLPTPAINPDHRKGIPGGSWGDVFVPSEPAPEVPKRTVQQDEPKRSTETPQNGNSDGTMEKRLVDEITSSSGIRVAPPPEAILTFVSRCESLSPKFIAKHLSVKISPVVTAWQTHLKALHVIEALIERLPDAYENEFKGSIDHLRDHLSSPHKAISDKAHKILVLLGVAQPKESPVQQQLLSSDATQAVKETKLSSPPSSSTSDAFNLFDGLSISDSMPAQSPAQPQAATKEQPKDALLDIFSTTSTAPPKPTQQKDDSIDLFFQELKGVPAASKQQPKPVIPTASPTYVVAPGYRPPGVPQAVPQGYSITPGVGKAYNTVNPVDPKQLYSALSAPAPGFDNLLSGNNKSDGFDFVQDEIKKKTK